ncbi:MAG: Biotin carboxylase [Phycisphaerae bacterium]|nr:Biotin carboxylase [Phycisphaerae bacterium]
MFSRILVANRGEIALRIIRACKELGVQVVAVYSEADRGAHYLDLADDAICIGPAAPSESYLNIAQIISAAEVANVEAIHPGYGFLAENSHFAEVCRSCKIEFIGPPVDAMNALGDKAAARRLVKECKVPTVPGSNGLIEEEADAVKLAGELGYPVIIKASAGGGGRGMRVVHNEATLRSQLRAAVAEAENAFGDGSVYLEKFIEQPRHVEVQILGDQHGNAVHFFERDCSLQRRHQKLMEETPSPHISDKTRGELCKAAVKLVKAAKYVGAGTVEFLVDRNENFYFIEANARIQVEHPVSELITGHDLIKWQLRVACGEPIDVKQTDIKRNGAAIECRINAEDPARNFAPCPGTITRFIPPGGRGVRLDTHAYAGYTIGPRYDSMIAKLIVHGQNRANALSIMRRALGEFVIEPIKTTIPFHLEILNHPDVVKGNFDTGFLERVW